MCCMNLYVLWSHSTSKAAVLGSKRELKMVALKFLSLLDADRHEQSACSMCLELAERL